MTSFKLAALFLPNVFCSSFYSFTQSAKPNQTSKLKMENVEPNHPKKFSKFSGDTSGIDGGKLDITTQIGVIELRNYVIKQAMRDSFIHYFEENFIAPQEQLKGHLLGQYRVKGFEDNFCWIRGFKNMSERSAFLPAFYYGSVWNQHKAVANSMLANNDNVYLLKPMMVRNDSLSPAKFITRSQLFPGNGIAVVDFYIANSKLDQLLKLFSKEYLPLTKNAACKISVCGRVLWKKMIFHGFPFFKTRIYLLLSRSIKMNWSM